MTDIDVKKTRRKRMVRISKAHAKKLGDRLGIDWNKVDLEQFRMGIEVEHEHAPTTGKRITKFAGISRDHLTERGYANKTYYTKLKKVETHEKPKKTVKKIVRKKR